MENTFFYLLPFVFICVSLQSNFVIACNHEYWNRSRTSCSDLSVKFFDVQAYGAVGNGLEDDTLAFSRAWAAACTSPSAILLVPGLKTFLLNHSIFFGPCEPGFRFQIDGTIVAPKYHVQWTNAKVWLQFKELENFSLVGSGMFLGQGREWWYSACEVVNHKRVCGWSPKAIQFEYSRGVIIAGITIVESPRSHLSFLGCHNVEVLSVRIWSPKTSPNTDGIHLEFSTNVLVRDCVIGSGDDCISVGKGSSNITIQDLTCGPGHGISVGSLGKKHSADEVSNVFIDGAKLIGTQNGLRIKTWQGGAGLANNIVFSNVQMVDTANPIIIDQYYCDSPMPCPNQTSAVRIANVTFRDITGTSATKVAVRLSCSKDIPCTGILLSDISLKLTSGGQPESYCENAQGSTWGTVNPPSCLL